MSHTHNTHTHTHTHNYRFSVDMLPKGVSILVVLHEAVCIRDTRVAQMDLTLPAEPRSISALVFVVLTIPTSPSDWSVIYTLYVR